MFWDKKPTPPEEPKPERIIEPPVIGKHFFADEESDEKYAGRFCVWSVSRVIGGHSNGVEGEVFRAWDRPQAASIVALLDAAVDRENEKKT
jgi:hypothetical protein